MAPGAISPRRSSLSNFISSPVVVVSKTMRTFLFNKNTSARPSRMVVSGVRHTYELKDGTKIYDASCGASVASLGRRQQRVEDAVLEQMRLGLSYVPALALDTPVTLELAERLIATTNGMLSKAIFYCSGSEASEAALKLITQYHVKEKIHPQPGRTKFIAREQSYHGATLGALDLSGHEARKVLYQGILPGNMYTLPACNPYRNRCEGETDAEYVQKRKDELVQMIEELGPETVAGLILEPVVGAALGCVPAVPGYLKAMREVCDEYGVTLVFDEVMCGMGRTGYLHAWQRDNVIPDVQLLGKGLAAGFGSISALLIGPKIANGFENGPSNGAFHHGHTFQNDPKNAAAALAVQNIIRDDNLLVNVRDKGHKLETKLKKRLSSHRYVGDIRGLGLFWGIEFVWDKETKEPFEPGHRVSETIYELGLQQGIHIYPGSGTADGKSGDHIMISPAFDIDDQDLDFIVEKVTKLINDYFDDFDLRHQ